MQREFTYSELLAEKESLECELESAQSECQVREAEIAKLKKRITSILSDFNETISLEEYRQLQQQRDDQSKRIQGLHQNIAELKNDIKFREEAQRDSIEKSVQLQKELDKEIKNGKSMRADLERLAQEYVIDRNELEELRREKEHSTKLVESLREQNENLTRFVESVKENQKHNLSEISHFSEQSFETLDVVIEIKLRETEEKLIESEKCVRMLQEKIQSLEAKKKDLKEKMDNMDLLIKHQKEEIAMLNETSNEEINKLSSMCENMEKEIANTVKLTEELQEAILTLEKELDRVKNSLSDAELVNREAKAKHEQEIGLLSDDLETHKQLVQALTVEKEQLHQTLAALQQKCETQESSELARELFEKQQIRLEELKQENEKSIEERKRLSGAQIQLETQLTEAKDQLASLECKHEAEVDKLNSTIDTLNLKLKIEQSRLSSLEQSRCEDQGKMQKIREILEIMTKERESLKSQLNPVLNENMNLREENEKLRCEMVANIKSSIGKVLNMNQACKECVTLNKDLMETKSKMSSMKKSQDESLHKFRVQIEQFKVQLNEKNRFMYDLKQEQKKLEWRLKEKDSQVQRLQTDLKCSQDSVVMEKTCNNKLYNEYRQACGAQSSSTGTTMDQSFNQIAYNRENDSIHFRKAGKWFHIYILIGENMKIRIEILSHRKSSNG